MPRLIKRRRSTLPAGHVLFLLRPLQSHELRRRSIFRLQEMNQATLRHYDQPSHDVTRHLSGRVLPAGGDTTVESGVLRDAQLRLGTPPEGEVGALEAVDGASWTRDVESAQRFGSISLFALHRGILGEGAKTLHGFPGPKAFKNGETANAA
jgi:hypothetical protein